MNTQSTFWALVRHDLKRHRNRNLRIPRQWWVAYGVTAGIIGLILFAYESRHIVAGIDNVWYATFGFAFAIFGMAMGHMVHEWRNGTVGWWLALPMSRMKLMMSKFLATLVRTVMVFAGFYALMVMLALYTLVLSGSYTPQVMGHFLLHGVQALAIALSAAPFLASLGLFYGVLNQSRLKPAMPMFWMVFGAGWWLASSQSGHYLHFAVTGKTLHMTVSAVWWIPLIASWIASYFIVRLAAYVLDRHLAM